MYKTEELRKKSDQELLKLVSELKGKLLALRFENATGQLNETHLLKLTKKDIAKVFTILNERKHNIKIEDKKVPSKKETTNSKKNVQDKNIKKTKMEEKGETK
ncbi:50S ribosomal protein L29 [Candidatus Hepatoplasma crinochetorum]|uniref:50S ribosomal protein L29 n=1 Tax=Candidatus Hepatoplasma crinochetorum TaxID=295596 RepID=UPI00308A0361|nr:MAG: hypothetical protein HCTKY_3840 [Candidatus Hepatoplasma crinochetorum]